MVTSQQTLGLLTHSLRSPHGKKWKHTYHTEWQAPQSLGKMHPIHSVSSPSDLQRLEWLATICLKLGGGERGSYLLRSLPWLRKGEASPLRWKTGTKQGRKLGQGSPWGQTPPVQDESGTLVCHPVIPLHFAYSFRCQ